MVIYIYIYILDNYAEINICRNKYDTNINDLFLVLQNLKLVCSYDEVHFLVLGFIYIQ